MLDRNLPFLHDEWQLEFRNRMEFFREHFQHNDEQITSCGCFRVASLSNAID